MARANLLLALALALPSVFAGHNRAPTMERRSRRHKNLERRAFVELNTSNASEANAQVAAAAGAGLGGFVPLGNGGAAAADAQTITSAPPAAATTQAAAAGSGGLGGFNPLGNGGGSGSNNNNGGNNNNDGNNGNGGNKVVKTVEKVTKTVQVLGNGDIKETDCIVKLTEEVSQANNAWLEAGRSLCASAAKNSNAVVSNTTGLLMCYRAGYVDQSNKQFGGELTVFDVGSASSNVSLAKAQAQMAFTDGTTLTTDTNALSASPSFTSSGAAGNTALTSTSTVNGASFVQVGSFHFNQALPSNFSGDLSALVPQSVNLATGQSSLSTLGLLDISNAAGLPSESEFANKAWGLFTKTTTDVSASNSTSKRGYDDDKSKSYKGSDKSSYKDGKDSKDSNNNNNDGSNNNSGKQTVIIEDRLCQVTITKSNSGVETISSGIVLTNTNVDQTQTVEVTKTVQETVTVTDTNTNGGGGGGSGSTSTSTSSSAEQTTTSSSSSSGSGSGSNNAQAGIGASVEGFGTSVDANQVSSVLASANAAGLGGSATVTATSSSDAGVGAAATAGVGAATTSSAVAGVTAADTAPSASSTPFQLPGRQLQVLPIGLGVFAGVSVIALVIVGVVTYERRKYRRQFRERRMAEQVAQGAGFGTFGAGRMTEARI